MNFTKISGKLRGYDMDKIRQYILAAINPNLKQGTHLSPKADISFRANREGKKSRVITFKANQLYWITTTEIYLKQNGHVLIDKVKGGSIGTGYAFSPEQVSEFFNVVG